MCGGTSNSGHNFLSPLYLWLPHHHQCLGPSREKCSIQIPVIFIHNKKPPTNQYKTTQQTPRTSKRNIFIPKCSRKDMGSGNIAIQSEDFILPLKISSCDLELPVLSIPLFSVWVQGQEPRQNPFFSPSFIPLGETCRTIFVLLIFPKTEK